MLSKKENIIEVSSLPKTWIIDIDGTICKHNGYKLDGTDTLLDGVKEFFSKIKSEDTIILTTSRRKEDAKKTEMFLNNNGIKFNHIIYELPYGERILINDRKPSGLNTSIAVNTDRDVFCKINFIENHNL